MRNTFLKLSALALLATASTAVGQSTDQQFPTPVRSSELTSSIRARAVGDPRITTYYYTFEGRQGDVFINVQSKNFTGDIDVFVMPSQQPLTKIVVYGDQPEAETGRVIYLRKPERLMLRVQGRAPGDDDASLRIKFAGSFEASNLDDSVNPAVPKVESTSETNVRVNSVGTILEVIPKATPTPVAVASRVDEEQPRPEPAETKVEPKEETVSNETRPVEVVVTDPVKTDEKPKADPIRSNTARSRRNRTVAPPKVEESVAEKEEVTVPSTTRRTTRTRPAPVKKPAEPKVDPMANVNLVIYFKDGSRIDRPMTEVLRFSVERAILTVISKNGTIGRYKMLDVSRVSIE